MVVRDGVEDVERITTGVHVVRESYSARPHFFNELVGHLRRGPLSAEHRADGSVEVEQHDGARGEKVSERHRSGSRATLVQMLSNHATDCATYCEAIESGSPSALWWNRVASLPMRSHIAVGWLSSFTVCSCTG